MKIKRQSLSNRIVHWVSAVSIFMLIFTGLGQMPVYKRYKLTDISWMQWSGDYHVTLILHYIFATILIYIVFYHMFYHFVRKEYDIIPKKGDIKNSILVIKAMILNKEEPPSDKYLPEQRLAYAFIGFWVIVMILTGILKVVKNISGINFSESAIFWLAQIHNIGFFMIILGVVAHLGAFIVKANRKLIPGMFSGKIDANYVKHRHKNWKEGVEEADKILKDK